MSLLDNCYGDAQLPERVDLLVEKFRQLRKRRSERIAELNLGPKQKRVKLDRKAVWTKTDGRCHICGGQIVSFDSYWEADHVFPRSSGGPSDIANYLPAHGLCNTVKLDQFGEELQWVLKIGVWAKTQMEAKTALGQEMLKRLWRHEEVRRKRPKPQRQAGAPPFEV